MAKVALFLLFLSKLASFSNNELPSMTRIIKGKPCDISEYPFLITFRQKTDSSVGYCGGTLISDNWVLTAAHCFDSNETTPEILAKDLFIVGEQGMSDIKKVYSNEFDMSIGKNDIALVKLETPIKATKYIKLPDKSLFSVDISGKYEECKSMGWGSTEEDHLNSTIQTRKNLLDGLMCVDLPLYNHEQCKEIYQHANIKITENQTCTASPEGKDTCQGDSGGPLICDGIQFGITSFGLGCGIPNMPGIQVRVDHYLDWIYKITGLKDPAEKDGLEQKPDRSSATSKGQSLLICLLMLLCGFSLRKFL